MPLFYSNMREREALDTNHGGPQWRPTLTRTSSLNRPSLNPLHAQNPILRCGISEQTAAYKEDDQGVVGYHSSANSRCGDTEVPRHFQPRVALTSTEYQRIRPAPISSNPFHFRI